LEQRGKLCPGHAAGPTRVAGGSRGGQQRQDLRNRIHGTFQISSGSIRSFRVRAYQFFTPTRDSRPEYGELEMSELALSPVTQGPLSPRREAELREAAQELEAAFLSEMLRHGGLGTPRDSYGGGHGEDQFASFLRTEQARAMAAGGGIGLAESLFNALAAREGSGR
jgi:hypothetical protein